MKVLLIGGTWNLTGGKKSGLIEKMYQKLTKEKDFDIDYFNGGYYEDLKNLVNSSKNYKIIFWMANVPNELEKVRDIKNVNPLAIVIGSKRNHYNEYSFVDILNKALLQRNNLTIEFSKNNNNSNFKMLLFDPLGTSWYEGYDLDELIKNLISRIRFLLTVNRERTYSNPQLNNVIEDIDFFDYVREVAEIFHKTIQHSEGVTRFLGNASYRKNNQIFVTERDIDKRLLNKNHIVECYLDKNKTFYYGNKKPSKDTVVQIKLYNILLNINYIVHSHCYVKNAPFTNIPIPCGALEEIDEILEVIKNNYNNDFTKEYYAINLKGHGCIIFGNNLELLKQTKFKTRYLPEKL